MHDMHRAVNPRSSTKLIASGLLELAVVHSRTAKEPVGTDLPLLVVDTEQHLRIQVMATVL